MQGFGRHAAMVWALVLPTGITYVYFILLADRSASLQQTAYTLGKILQFGLPILWWWCEAPPQLETPAPLARRGIPHGLLFGCLAALAGLALYALVLKPAGAFDLPLRAVEAKVGGLGLDTTWKYLTLSVFYCVVHSALEEYYWRWFVFRRLTAFTSPHWAIAISSLGFMAHHVLVLANFFGWHAPATYLFSLAVAVGGAFWAWLYLRSRSLLGSWLSHLLIDALIFAIGFDLVRGSLR